LARRALDVAQNPFLAAELRSPARRQFLVRSVLLHTLALSSLFVYLLKLAGGPSLIAANGFQHMLRGQLVTGLAAVHAWLVIHASDARAREAAQREEAARMWEMLLVTPLSPAEIVLFKSVFPLLYAGLIALLALPLYLLAAAISGVSLETLLLLYVVYGLLMVRWVAPLQPAPAGRGKRRRASHAAGAFGHLFVWLWVLSFFGQALRPISPLASAMIITWPVVAAELLPAPFRFFRFTLPPLVALLVLGPLVCLINLRWAAQRLVTQATEPSGTERQGLLRRAAIAGTALAALGYAWPRMIEGGSLGAWAHLGAGPGPSVAALGWLLLGLWWLLFGAGGLLNLASERLEDAGIRRPRFVSGWLGRAEPGRRVTEVAGLVAPPLVLLGVSCLLGWQLPPLSTLSWLGRTAAVSLGAAALTVSLAHWLRPATLSGRAADLFLAWIPLALLIVAPLSVLFWAEPHALWGAALSPVMGFLTLLPPDAPLSPAARGPLPPWWLCPVLNCGTAAFLSVGWRRPAAADAGAAAMRRRAPEGSLSRGAERLAGRFDYPVLVKELRASARRGEWRRWMVIGSLIAIALLALALYDSTIITGFVSGFPLRFLPAELDNPNGLSDIRFFCASLMVVVVVGLSWPIVLGPPLTGATAFAQERRKGTLGFMLLTPLSNAAIVQQKLAAAVAPMLLALALTFPICAAAALLSLDPMVLWSFLFSYAWLLVACLSGGAIGTLGSLLLPGAKDPQSLPVLAVLLLQGLKLYTVARLQYLLAGADDKLAITAWYVVPLVVVEAGIGFLAYAASVAALARTRSRDLRFVTEK
jgi:ABC-type transport system involved in cytochrome c biogenesis permease component